MKTLKCKESDKEINNKCKEIIDSLHNFSLAGKYKVVSVLYDSLVDLLKEEGYMIVDKEEPFSQNGSSKTKEEKE